MNAVLERGRRTSSQLKTENEFDHYSYSSKHFMEFIIPRYPQSRIPNVSLAKIPIVDHVLASEGYNKKLQDHVNNAVDKGIMATKNIPWRLTARGRALSSHLTRRIFQIRDFFFQSKRLVTRLNHML